MQGASLILPVPLSAQVLKNGGVESLILHNKEVRFRIPAGGRAGSRICLPGKAHLIDPSMGKADLHLLVLPENERLYSVRRDVELDIHLPSDKLKRGTLESINLGGRRFDVKIPAGTANGQRVRLRGLGQHCNGGYAGDIYLRMALSQRRTRWLGVFDHFGKPTERVIGISFNIPFLSFYHEWVYETKTVGLGISR
jgi:DnaJ-class molecular chaperone